MIFPNPSIKKNYTYLEEFGKINYLVGMRKRKFFPAMEGLIFVPDIMDQKSMLRRQ